MKHLTYFQDFLSKEVNLNETRLQKLNSSSSAVDTFLSGNLDLYEKTERQGLYCHRKFRPLSKPRLCYNTILLKGVSDGETKTKKLHPGV